MPEANRGDGTDMGWRNWMLGPQNPAVFDLPSYGCAGNCDPGACAGRMAVVGGSVCVLPCVVETFLCVAMHVCARGCEHC